jgi:hypothetical protein
MLAEEADGPGDRVGARLDDEAGAPVGDDVERAAGIGRGHDRLLREERLVRNHPVVLVDRRVVDGEAACVQVGELGLADAAETVLKKAGVTTIRLSAPNTTTDYSSYVTRVPSDTNVVFFPTQKPGDAQTMAQQLLEQGKKAKVFGGDGSNDPSQFKVPGSYVSNFAAPISLFPYNKSIIAGWLKDNNGKVVGSFGPPTYGAVQILFKAIKQTCADGGGVITSPRRTMKIG